MIRKYERSARPAEGGADRSGAATASRAPASGSGLELPDASVDAVLAHTLLSHVTDPAAVLAEAARVLRPGGTVAIFDGDYSSWTWACSDPELARATEDALRVVIASKPRVMRDLPALLPGAGLTLAASHAHVYAEIGEERFVRMARPHPDAPYS